MIAKQLINPQSIVVVGASNNVEKPGGKVLKNLIDGNFKRSLYCVNPKESEVQGVKSYASVKELPQVDLAIIAIAAEFVPETVELLAHQKSTRAFIILSAGFSEESHKGAGLEKKVVDIVNGVNGTLIGPNCTGVLTQAYSGIFTLPLPKLDKKGCDFITGSGATACFVLESGIPKGLRFSSIFAVGNSAQTGVEEILEYFDESYEPGKSSKIKILYIENISKPQKLLKHASSLISKGCRIAAIKAGASEAGSRAASSHTGALASPDAAVDALFRKAGIVRCHGREELITAACIFSCPELTGSNVAIITHAGGPAVMLTDALSNGGLCVPKISGEKAEQLLEKLYHGSSVSNPIDFLATGTPEQLGAIIDTVEKDFDEIDGMAVIFGTPGLTKIFDAYRVLDEKMKTCRKPLFPILTSPLTAKEEVEEFISKGRCFFPDEVIFGNMLTKVYNTNTQHRTSNTQRPSQNSPPVKEGWPQAGVVEKTHIIQPPYTGTTLQQVGEFFNIQSPEHFTCGVRYSPVSISFREGIRKIIDNASSGYLSPEGAAGLLDSAGIPRVSELTVKTETEAVEAAEKTGYPLVLKVIGPVHKSDTGGVALNLQNPEDVRREFLRLMKIENAAGVLLQPMLSGMELFVGAKFEPKFGHMVMCGLGGIFVEALKDVSMELAPLSKDNALSMIRSLKGYKIIKGLRGQKGVDENVFADIICKLSALLEAAPEIIELDINPLLSSGDKIIAVDSRIRIEKCSTGQCSTGVPPVIH